MALNTQAGSGSPTSVLLFLLAAGTTALPLAAQSFVDVTVAAGLSAPYATGAGSMATGIAAADYDGDGWVDIFQPMTLDVPDRLYRNLGDGTFGEIGAQVGLASTEAGRAALWLDHDGDGDLDLLVAGDCNNGICRPGASWLRLYRQDANGSFTEVTETSGLFDNPNEHDQLWHRAGLAAGDLSNDGHLDLYTGMWGLVDGRLWFNQGDGTFAEGVLGSPAPPSDNDWQAVMHDFNRDGWLDLFVAVDFGSNRLWINQGDLTFVDVAQNSGVDSSFNEMGVALGDCDDDGDFDIYVTNISEGGKHNVLFRNDWAPGDDCAETPSLDPCFVEIAGDVGVDHGWWGWGTTFIDGDNEGLLDIAATNGFAFSPWSTDPSRYFVNQGGVTLDFVESSAAVGVADTDWGSSLLAVDYDRDGDLDLLQSTVGPEAHLRLMQNQLVTTADAPRGAGAHYLSVQPRSSGTNSHAIGAVVRARTGGKVQSRLITAGTSLLGQEPAEAFFGLGTAAEVDELTVEWPDGVDSRFDLVTADRLLPIRRGAAADLSITIDDGVAETAAASQLTYLVEVANSGGGDVTDAVIAGPEPPGLSCSWQCSAAAGFCAPGPTAGAIADQVDLLSGGSAVYTVDCAVDAGTSGLIARTVTATPPGETTDPLPTNNSATDATVILETGACGLPDHRYLVDLEVIASETYEACTSIRAGQGVEVRVGGSLTLRSPTVVLLSGAVFGGELTVAGLP
jgi:hypothetical protein